MRSSRDAPPVPALSSFGGTLGGGSSCSIWALPRRLRIHGGTPWGTGRVYHTRSWPTSTARTGAFRRRTATSVVRRALPSVVRRALPTAVPTPTACGSHAWGGSDKRARIAMASLKQSPN